MNSNNLTLISIRIDMLIILIQNGVCMKQVKKEIFEKFMQDKKLTKTEFCKNCGICVKTFNNLLNGKNSTIISVIKIADYTGFKIQDMYY